MKYTYNTLKHLLIVLTWTTAMVHLGSCTDDETPSGTENLASYISNSNLDIQLDSLIACAAGGQNGILADPGNTAISIIYLPLEDISNIRYYETESMPENPSDYTAYQEIQLPQTPLLNGFLRKFNRETPQEAVYGIVSFERNGKIFLSNPIHLKQNTAPTDYSTAVSVDTATPLMPVFSWQTLDSPDNAIYFQVVSDEAGNLLSGTYTITPTFQFYNLDNVVLNVNDITPAPTLNAGETYLFTVLGVSLDNWVNLHADVSFTAE